MSDERFGSQVADDGSAKVGDERTVAIDLQPKGHAASYLRGRGQTKMNSDQPPYPMTMTPPANTPITAEGIQRAYGSRAVDARLRLVLEAQREILRAWDTYEGGPSAAREGAKKAIAELLCKQVGRYQVD